MHKREFKGFTLIELIIVVAIIGLLAAALFVAIDPAKRIGEARDAQRWSDITSILNSVLTYTADVTTLPTQVSGLAAGNFVISLIPTGDATTQGCPALNPAAGLDTPVTRMSLKDSLVDYYLSTLPVDPSLTANATTTTGYYISKSSGGRITVGSCYESGSATASITVQR